MVTYDYSDSEDEQASGMDPVDHVDREVLDAGNEEKPNVAAKPTTGSSTPTSLPHPNPSIRIKIKPPKSTSTPNTGTAETAREVDARHQRSSLSPPPPLTLRFGLPPAAPSSSRSIKAEKAAYSSSEDDGDEYGPSGSKGKKPLSKSKKPTNQTTPKGSKKKPQPQESQAQSHGLLAPELQSSGNSAGRKSYDWLIPSSAGASHRGPEGRERTLSSGDGELDSTSATVPGPAPQLDVKEKEKRSHKRRRDGEVPGPGKAWRKGIKKGMIRIAKEGGTETPGTSTPGNSRPGSPEGTPEEEEARTIESRIQVAHVPADDGPFVLADPVALGHPVFSRPIAQPKMILSTFPKVTPYFLPNNGGDTGPFPRKQKTRSWKNSERTFVGVGGGTLKFKSWTKGPPSELTQILKAEKDANDIKAKASKEGGAAKINVPKDKESTDAKPKPQRLVSLAPRPSPPSSIAPRPSPPSVTPEMASTFAGLDPSKPLPSVLMPYDGPTPLFEPQWGNFPPPTNLVHPPPINTAGSSTSGPPPKKKPRTSKSRPKAPARPPISQSPSSESIASLATDADPSELQASASKGPRKSKLAQEIHPDAEGNVPENEDI